MTADREQGRTLEHTVPDSVQPIRIDSYLADLDEVGLSRTRIQKLLTDGLIRLDGREVPPRTKLTGGEQIAIHIPPTEQTDLAPENIPIEILFEDDYLAVVNKPPGLVTHPAPGNYSGTLVNALIHHFQSLPSGSGADRPGIVHRLDKHTSGLLVVAKREEAYAALQEAIQTRTLKRTYLAVVFGHMRDRAGLIDLPIGRSSRNRKKMAVMEQTGRAAQTEYRVLERYRSFDLLELSLLTGRTHQIRVHCAHLGHPVLGDPEYGGRSRQLRGIFAPERPLAQRLLENLDRQALHAAALAFTHPFTGEPVEVSAPPPTDMQMVLDLLDREGR
ncbi:RluA family pseudouridine synthase [candidate division GN15 bacterium]|nr:RluA family pseudouridine synthase [candidate division GN15 bacterium]